MNDNFELWEHATDGWTRLRSFLMLVDVVDDMVRRDQHSPMKPRRITHRGMIIAWGRYAAVADQDAENRVHPFRASDKPAPPIRTEPFWIVHSLDKPGPVERGDKPFTTHGSFKEAREEARRLSAACRGGRFAVMQLAWATGWFEEDHREATIPF